MLARRRRRRQVRAASGWTWCGLAGQVSSRLFAEHLARAGSVRAGLTRTLRVW